MHRSAEAPCRCLVLSRPGSAPRPWAAPPPRQQPEEQRGRQLPPLRWTQLTARVALPGALPSPGLRSSLPELLTSFSGFQQVTHRPEPAHAV